jgi:glucose-1-phosphate thymidylyltransferase
MEQQSGLSRHSRGFEGGDLNMWGIVPAAGMGSRIQPLAFSKELLPVGSRASGNGERPRAVSEYILERMVIGGVDKICIIVAPDKLDILQYFATNMGPAKLFYTVQPSPAGLCDAIFRAAPLIAASEPVVLGLPDTIWFPEDALCGLSDEDFSFLLFPVQRPERFDAVLTDEAGQVCAIQVKQPNAQTPWIWGAIKMPGKTFAELHQLWREHGRSDEYLGSLANAYIMRGGRARGVRAGHSYFDVGSLAGYREAMQLLSAGAVTGSATAMQEAVK